MKISIFSSPTDPIEAMRVHKQRNWLAYSLLLGSFTLWPLHLWIKNRPVSAPSAPAVQSRVPMRVEPITAPPIPAETGASSVETSLDSSSRQTVVEIPAARQALVDLAQQYIRMRSYSDVTTLRYYQNMPGERAPLGLETDATFRFARAANRTRIEDISPARRFFGVRVGNQLRVRDTRIGEQPTETLSKVVKASDLGRRLRLTTPGLFVVSGEGADRFPALDIGTTATYGPNEVIDGVPCQVINLTDTLGLRIGFNAQGTAGQAEPRYRDYKICIGIKDGLLHQMRRRHTWGNRVWERVETHSSIKVNPKLPASTWDFVGS